MGPKEHHGESKGRHVDQVIEVHHQFDPVVVDLLKGMQKLLRDIYKQGECIMATQKELADGLTAITAQVKKIGDESTITLQKVTALEEALKNAGNTTPEVDAAFAALKAQTQVVDDLIPDPVPTP